MNWIISHRNVAIVLTFGESDNLIKAPNSKGVLSSDRGLDLFNFAETSNDGVERVGMFTTTQRGFGRFGGFRGGGGRSSQQQPASGRQRRPGRKAATTVNSADLEYFTTISKKYIEITDIKVQPVIRTPKGAFFEYAYYQYGVPSFSTPGWGISSADTDTSARRSKSSTDAAPIGGREGMRGNMMAGRGGQSGARPTGQGGGSSGSDGIDKELLKWMEKENVEGFVDWKTFNHPTLGEVEIGGFSPYKVTNPPAGKIAELGTKHGEFAVYLSTLYGKVKIAETEVKNHGGGIFTITAEVENRGFLPTALAHGVTSRSVKPTMVQLGVKPDQIISGSSKTNFFQSLAGSGKRQKYEWIIKGKTGDKIELKVVSQKAGSDKTIITLK